VNERSRTYGPPPGFPQFTDTPTIAARGDRTPFYGGDYDADGNPVPGLLDEVRNGVWLDKQDFPPLRYHVPGIVPEGLTVLAGAPKVGKSWLVLGWLLAVAAGGRALSSVSVPPGHVLYLALEDGDRRMQARCRTLLGNAWRPDDAIPARFEYLLTVAPGLLIATITEWLHQHPAGLVVVDTLGRVLPPALKGETPYMRDYRIMSSLKDVADAFPGAALVMNHHDRKAVTADFVNAVSGTNGIAGGADTVLVLTRAREDPAGLIQVTGRDVTEAAYALTFEGGIWRLDGHDLDSAASAARQRRAAMRLSDRSAEVLGLAAARPEGIRAADVASALDIDLHTARTYLARLADHNRITRAARGLYTPVASVASVASAGQDPCQNATPPVASVALPGLDATHATTLLRPDQGSDQATQQRNTCNTPPGTAP
jgi:DNA-binding CsgD family transcriptional regulator